MCVKHSEFPRVADSRELDPRRIYPLILSGTARETGRDASAIFSLPNKKQDRTKPAKTEQDHATVEKIGP
jgi:hypothetical protein